IRGPSHKLSVSLDVLRKELEEIENQKYEDPFITARIEHTKNRQHTDQKAFFSIEQIKQRGGTYIGLEVPPVYRDDNGELYPRYFRKFRDEFSYAIQKAVFEFVRVQTVSDIKGFAALGKRKIHDEVFKIDRA